MGEDQLALRTNDRWLPEEKGPTTNEKGLTTNADFGWVIPVNDNVAFGIPTDLETVRRTDRGRSGARGREGGGAQATVVSSASSKSVRRQAFQLLVGFHGAPVAPRNAAAQISTSALNSLSFWLFACCMLE